MPSLTTEMLLVWDTSVIKGIKQPNQSSNRIQITKSLNLPAPSCKIGLKCSTEDLILNSYCGISLIRGQRCTKMPIPSCPLCCSPPRCVEYFIQRVIQLLLLILKAQESFKHCSFPPCFVLNLFCLCLPIHLVKRCGRDSGVYI